MADQKINALPSKTAPTTGDKMLMVGTAEEYLIDYDKLATAILNKLSSQSFSSLDTTAKTLLGAVNELNSKTLGNIAYYDANTDHTSETARSQALIQVLNQFKNNNTNTYLVSVIRYYNGYYFTYVASIQSGGSSFYVLEYSASMSAINIWNVTRTLNSATITRRFSDDATVFTPQDVAITDGDYGHVNGNFKRIGSLLVFSFWITPTKEYIGTSHDPLFTFDSIKSSGRYDIPIFQSYSFGKPVAALFVNNGDNPYIYLGNDADLSLSSGTLFCSGTMIVTDK